MIFSIYSCMSFANCVFPATVHFILVIKFIAISLLITLNCQFLMTIEYVVLSLSSFLTLIFLCSLSLLESSWDFIHIFLNFSKNHLCFYWFFSYFIYFCFILVPFFLLLEFNLFFGLFFIFQRWKFESLTLDYYCL